MKTLIALLFALLLSSLVRAQDSTGFAFQFDASPYLFNGYSVKAVFYPKWFQRGSIGVESFAMDYPDFYFTGDNENWTGRAQIGLDASIDFSLSRHRFKGLFAGPVVVYLRNRMENEQAVTFDQIEAGVKVNYKFFPVRNLNLFLNPYVFAYYSHEIGGSSGDYTTRHLGMLGSVFVGWQF